MLAKTLQKDRYITMTREEYDFMDGRVVEAAPLAVNFCT